MTDSEQVRSEGSEDSAPCACTGAGLPISRIDNRISTTAVADARAESAGDSDDPAEHGDTGLIVAPEKPKLAKPPLWKVVMLNDDYTPMEFVVDVLQIFFGMNREKATQIMLAVHTMGKATCGIFPRTLPRQSVRRSISTRKKISTRWSPRLSPRMMSDWSPGNRLSAW